MLQTSVKELISREGKSRKKLLDDYSTLNKQRDAMKGFLEYARKEMVVHYTEFHLHKRRLVDRNGSYALSRPSDLSTG